MLIFLWFPSYLVGIIDPMQSRNSAQGYKDGRSREISTTVRSQPITQGVLGGPAGSAADSTGLNTIRQSIPEKQEEIVITEEFPSWAGNMTLIRISAQNMAVFMNFTIISYLHRHLCRKQDLKNPRPRVVFVVILIIFHNILECKIIDHDFFQTLITGHQSYS